MFCRVSLISWSCSEIASSCWLSAAVTASVAMLEAAAACAPPFSNRMTWRNLPLSPRTSASTLPDLSKTGLPLARCSIVSGASATIRPEFALLELVGRVQSAGCHRIADELRHRPSAAACLAPGSPPWSKATRESSGPTTSALPESFGRRTRTTSSSPGPTGTSGRLAAIALSCARTSVGSAPRRRSRRPSPRTRCRGTSRSTSRSVPPLPLDST